MVEPDFISIVFFYTNIALQHLGVINNPLTDRVEKNIELAKYIIDTLDLIKEKTKGNLTEKEESILLSTLSDLKLSYVKTKESEEKAKGEEITEKSKEKVEGNEMDEETTTKKKSVKVKKKAEGNQKKTKKTKRKTR